MSLPDSNSPRWYVMRWYGGLPEIEERLADGGFRYFIPKKSVLRRAGGSERLTMVSAAPPYVFVYAAYDRLDEFQKPLRLLLYSKRLRPVDGHTTITVGEREMDDFIRVATQNEKRVRIHLAGEIDLRRGDRVRICGGVLDGVEGVMLRLEGVRDRRLVVSVPGIMSVSTPVDRTFVQRIE